MDKEVKIIPPEGYEIDKENSTFECIKFKPIVKKWRDKKEKVLFGWYIDSQTSKIYQCQPVSNTSESYNVFATEKQAKSALAMARISQIMANDERFGGVVTDEEWKDGTYKYCIIRSKNRINWTEDSVVYHFLSFHTEKQCCLFFKENEDLVREYFML